MAIDFPVTPSDGYVKWWGDGVRHWVYRASDNTWTRRGGTAMAKNRFTNPAFQINEQTGLANAWNVQGLTLAEQLWAYYNFTGGGQYRGERLALATPGGSNYRLRLSCTATTPSVTSANWLAFSAPIEASKMVDFEWGDAANLKPKWAVVRFGWKSPAGTYCFGFRNAGQTECYAYEFTITPTQANTDTLQVAIIPPNYWETWPVGNAYWGSCYWSLINGSMLGESYEWYDGGAVASVGMTNTFMSTIGNTAELFDIGFYLDPNITGIPPEFEVPHIEDALMECQRYWYKMTASRGTTYTATIGFTQGVHPVPMRVNPGTSLVGTQRLHDATALGNWASINHNNCNRTNIYMGFNTSVGGYTPGRPFQQLSDGQTDNYVAMSARM
jgi:hypothetical protein